MDLLRKRYLPKNAGWRSHVRHLYVLLHVRQAAYEMFKFYSRHLDNMHGLEVALNPAPSSIDKYAALAPWGIFASMFAPFISAGTDSHSYLDQSPALPPFV